MRSCGARVKTEEENLFMELKKEKVVQRRHLIFEPIKGCKHPFIASGATSIGSAGRAPDEIKREEKTIFLSLYPKIFDYSLGATPIRSTGRAPDEDGKY
jgi:hypothetical protein